MNARFVMIAAAALTIAANAAAEPPKVEAREASQPANRPAEVLLASAEQIRTPTPTADQPSATPVKRPRAARVTTCRCGDPQQK